MLNKTIKTLSEISKQTNKTAHCQQGGGDTARGRSEYNVSRGSLAMSFDSLTQWVGFLFVGVIDYHEVFQNNTDLLSYCSRDQKSWAKIKEFAGCDFFWRL